MGLRKKRKPSRTSVFLLVLRLGIKFHRVVEHVREVMTPWLWDQWSYLQIAWDKICELINDLTG
jgi:hypothetical protein